MVFFNYATMQMAAKIVYYGPGLCGKTTNLHWIYAKTTPQSRGEMVSLETETDRTLFFDLLPLDVGVIGGFKTRLQLYTIPGQVFYNTTRKLVLKGVDGVVFVADLQRAMLDANIESFRNLRENLSEIGLDLDELPVVIQLNKRDLPNTIEREVLLSALDPEGKYSHVEAAAVSGEGVFETLKEISKLTLRTLRRRMMGEENRPSSGRSRAPAPPPPPPRPRETTVGFAPPPTNARGISVGPAAAQIPVATARDATSPASVAGIAAAPDLPRFEENPFPETEYASPAILEDHPVIGDVAEPGPSDLESLPGDDEEESLGDESVEALPADEEPDDEQETGSAEGPEPGPQAEQDDFDQTVPPIKRVKVRSTSEIIAELDGLRKMATQTMLGPGPRSLSRHVRRTVRAPLPVPPAASNVRISLSFEDPEGNVVQQQEQSVELEQGSEVEGFLIKLEMTTQK